MSKKRVKYFQDLVPAGEVAKRLNTIQEDMPDYLNFYLDALVEVAMNQVVIIYHFDE